MKKRKKYNVDPIRLETFSTKTKKSFYHTIKKQIYLSIISVLSVTIIMLGTSYSIFTSGNMAKEYNTVEAGTLNITYDDKSSGLGNIIKLVDAFPITDEMGMKGTPYKFKIANNFSLPISYSIRFLDDIEKIKEDKCSTSQLNKKYLKYSINNNSGVLLSTVESQGYVVKTGVLMPGASEIYEIRMWLTEQIGGAYVGNDVLNKHYHGKVVIEGGMGSSIKDYVDSSGANKPELGEGLIPVIYDDTKKEWVKANIKEKWYAYNEQMWANAVTTTETNRNTYINALPGTIISMDDINTMWVWIPKYEYMTTNLANNYAGGTALQPGIINMNFLNQTKKEPSSSNYKIHPSFDNVSGFWAGKFETSKLSSCTPNSYAKNTDCDLTNLNVQIKPNVSSWRGIRVSTAFSVAREMSNQGNTYGLNNIDSHMMKNTEWGAVAYLSQSIYGKQGNSTFIGTDKEVYINNAENYMTGCSSGGPSKARSSLCDITYDVSSSGTGASTTGNIYGIYDMSGCSYEYVMGNMKEPGNINQMSGYKITKNYNSGFTGINYDNSLTDERPYPLPKYYDTYNYSEFNIDHSSRYILGDATYEVSQGDGNSSGWYSDSADFIHTNYPWFIRGGIYNNTNIAGIFSFNGAYGTAKSNNSFRVVLKTLN